MVIEREPIPFTILDNRDWRRENGLSFCFAYAYGVVWKASEANPNDACDPNPFGDERAARHGLYVCATPAYACQ